MYVVIVEFTIHPERYSDFLARVRQQAVDTLDAEADCHVFDICVAPDRAFVLLYEVYSDQAAFDTHLESQHFHDFSAAVVDWVSDKNVTSLEKI